jgi:hypothetical protein
MNFYIAAINFKNYSDLSFDVTTRIKMISDRVPQIHKDAINEFGENAITLIVLHEGAVTPVAVPNKVKKECLNKLEKVIAQHKKMLLIPGSFLFYDKFSELPDLDERKRKIMGNYLQNLDDPRYKSELHFMEDFMKASGKIVGNKLTNDTLCLQNSTYILGGDNNKKIIKHKKSITVGEEKHIAGDFLFYPGVGHFTKDVLIDNNFLEIGLNVCMEHNLRLNDELRNNPPTLGVIVSASVKLKKENLFGALNIYMDETNGLSAYINDKHPKKDKIGKLKLYTYECTSNKKIERPVIHFSNDVFKHPINNIASQKIGSGVKMLSAANKESSLKRGFFNSPGPNTPLKDLSEKNNAHPTQKKATGQENNNSFLKRGFLLNAPSEKPINKAMSTSIGNENASRPLNKKV